MEKIEQMEFYPGLEFSHHGCEYRVIDGRNCQDDMIIQFRLPGSEWYTPPIAHILILFEFKAIVEENNYGPNGKVKKDGRGKFKLFEVAKNVINGNTHWKYEAAIIDEEVRNKKLGPGGA